jgi:hypothetical protein
VAVRSEMAGSSKEQRVALCVDAFCSARSPPPSTMRPAKRAGKTTDSQPKDYSVRDMVPCRPHAARFNALEHADYYTGEGRKDDGFPRTLVYKIVSGFGNHPISVFSGISCVSKLVPNHKTVSRAPMSHHRFRRLLKY